MYNKLRRKHLAN